MHGIAGAALMLLCAGLLSAEAGNAQRQQHDKADAHKSSAEFVGKITEVVTDSAPVMLVVDGALESAAEPTTTVPVKKAGKASAKGAEAKGKMHFKLDALCVIKALGGGHGKAGDLQKGERITITFTTQASQSSGTDYIAHTIEILSPPETAPEKPAKGGKKKK